MNRRGNEYFMLGLDILFLIAIVLIFWKIAVAFEPQQQSEEIGARQLAAIHTYNLAEEMLLYLDVAAAQAAQETLATLARKGAINPVGGECASYATYNTLDAQDCAATQEVVDEAFSKEFLRVLKTKLNYPGLPREIGYDVTLARGQEGIIVTGRTEDQVLLPILLIKGAPQAEMDAAILQGRALDLRSATYAPDSDVQGVGFMRTTNTAERSGTVTGVLIIGTGEDATEATYRYTEGSESVHYLIDRYGKITQFVPESKRAIRPACSECRKEIGERVVIALVLPAPSPSENDQCPAGSTEERMTDWCGTAPFSGWGSCGTPSTESCWADYDPRQEASLKALVTDILTRYELSPDPEHVLLLDQVWEEAGSPGPTLFQGEQRQAYASFLSSLTGTQPQEQESQAAPAVAVQLALPVKSPATVTSCYGARTVNGKVDNKHDGLDFGGEGNPVYAIADGYVQAITPCGNSCGSGLGNTILIRHTNALHTRYSHMRAFADGLKEGDQVARGQQIGTIGSTGSSTAPHLDLKIFVDGRIDGDQGINPLCVFPEDILAQLTRGSNAASCEEEATPEGKFTRAYEGLAKECAGVTSYSSAPGCVVMADLQGISGDPLLTEKLDQIQAVPGLMEAIQTSSAENGVDPRVTIALISWETRHKPLMVANSYGYVGPGQFGEPACRDLQSIFGAPCNDACRCKSGTCDPRTIDACANDPRLDVVKNARAVPKYLALQKAYLKGAGVSDILTMRDADWFAVMAHNAGAAQTANAIKAAMASNADPTIEQVLAAFDTTMADAINGNIPVEQKLQEVKEYTPSIMRLYASQGGTRGSGDTTCAGVTGTVKNVGSYAFTPSFRVTVPDTLTTYGAVTSHALAIQERCGRDDDPRSCVAREFAEMRVTGADVVACESVEGAKEVLLDVQELITDCATNFQDDCTCPGTIPVPQGAYQLFLDGSSPYLKADGAWINGLSGPWETRSSLTPTAPITSAPLELEILNNDPDTKLLFSADTGYPGGSPLEQQGDHMYERIYSYTIPADPGDGPDLAPVRSASGTQVFHERLMKREGEITLVQDARGGPVCGVHKTTHRVCVNITTPVRVGEELIHPILRFSITPNDETPPEPVVKAVGTQVQQAAFTGMVVVITPSPSEDISFYRITCTAGWEKPVDVNARDIEGDGSDSKISVDIAATTPMCVGTMNVFPYDITGKSGQGKPVEIQTDNAWQSLLQGEINEETIMNAVLQYYGVPPVVTQP